MTMALERSSSTTRCAMLRDGSVGGVGKEAEICIGEHAHKKFLVPKESTKGDGKAIFAYDSSVSSSWKLHHVPFLDRTA